MNEEQSPWLTVQEARARAKCGRSVILRAISSGKLKAVKVGHKYLVHVGWLDAWLDAAATVVNEEAPGPALVYRPGRNH
jgi:excisionase family DNA binding protein